MFLAKLNSEAKNLFLKITFKQREYFQIKAIENIITCIPFILFLCYKKFFFSALVLFSFSFLMIFFKQRGAKSFTIPTPFSKQPFEFILGFRENFLTFPFLLFLTIKSISVNNFNLGIFSLFATALVCLTFYFKLEPPYFVWIFNHNSAKQFLFSKIKTGIVHFMFISTPSTLLLTIYFHENIEIIALVYALSICYIITMILAKYANYPHKISILEAFIITISFLFFPLLIILIPHLYSKAIKQIKTILE